MVMPQEELDRKLELHKKWLGNERGGVDFSLEVADLRNAKLRNANLMEADLRHADLRQADLSYANLIDADLSGANLAGANLVGAVLVGAELKNVDLKGADLDYSCLPLWSGSLNANFDDKQLIQIMYHAMSIAKNSKNISKELRKKLLTDNNIEVANNFHRVEEFEECKRIEK